MRALQSIVRIRSALVAKQHTEHAESCLGVQPTELPDYHGVLVQPEGNPRRTCASVWASRPHLDPRKPRGPRRGAPPPCRVRLARLALPERERRPWNAGSATKRRGERSPRRKAAKYPAFSAALHRRRPPGCRRRAARPSSSENRDMRANLIDALPAVTTSYLNAYESDRERDVMFGKPHASGHALADQ